MSAALADAELLIADGHHRYETARIYADEIGGDGPHRYTLVCLVSLEDPGLTVFATHRLLRDLDRRRQERARRRRSRALRRRGGRRDDRLDPAGERGHRRLRLHRRRIPRDALRLRLKDPGGARRGARRTARDAYRSLDAAILEELILQGRARDERRGHRRQARARLRERAPSEALRQLDAGDYEAAFLLRPTPVEQVREVAAAGETMPPKSTYFFPKLLTGIVFNPLQLSRPPRVRVAA